MSIPKEIKPGELKEIRIDSASVVINLDTFLQSHVGYIKKIDHSDTFRKRAVQFSYRNRVFKVLNLIQKQYDIQHNIP